MILTTSKNLGPALLLSKIFANEFEIGFIMLEF